MRRRRTSPPKVKKLAYELIADEPGGIGRQMHNMLRDLVREFRPDLRDARLALAWCHSWKADADGRVVLGKCKKASDLDRELMEFDFIILINRSFWTDPEVSDQQRRALLDHELMHAAVKCKENGEPEEDAKGRIVYRIRKHDVEEFGDTVARHGIWKNDLQAFAQTLRAAALKGFTPCESCKAAGTPGWREITIDGTRRQQRCPCWITYRNRLDPEGAPPPLKAQQAPLPNPEATPPVPPTH